MLLLLLRNELTVFGVLERSIKKDARGDRGLRVHDKNNTKMQSL